MAETLNYKTNVDTKEAEQNLEDLTDSIKDTGKAAEDTAEDMDDMADKTEDVGKKAKQTKKGLGGVKEGLVSMGGPIGAVITGFQGVLKVMKLMLTNPLGIALTALVGVFYALKRALTDSEEGQNKLNRIMSVAGALFGNLMDLVADFGEAVIKAVTEPVKSMKSFAKGVIEFIKHPIDSVTKAYGDAKKGLKDFADEQVNEAKAADKVAQMRNKAHKMERDLMIERATLENKIAELRLKSRMEDSVSAEERKQALLDAQALEDQLLGKEVKVLELRRDAQKLENTFSRTNIENADKEAEATAKVIQIQARRTNQQRATQRELNRVNKEIERDAKAAEKKKENQRKAKEKAAEKKRKDDEKAAKDKKIADEKAAIEAIEKKAKLEQIEAQNTAKTQEELAQRLIEIEQSKNKALVDELAKQGKDTTDIELKIAKQKADEKFKIEADAAKKADELQKKQDKIDDAATKAREENIAAVSGALSNLSGVFAEHTIAAKAINVAQAVMDTYTGATKALAQGGTFGFIGAAAVIAAGLANVQKILSTEIPEAQGKDNVTASVAGGAMSAGPNTAIVGDNVDSNTQITRSLNAAMNKPIRSYVVGQEVSTQQSLDRKISQNATLGG